MKNTCEHKNRKNLNSNNNPYNNSNYIEVLCLDCGFSRYETRYKNGRVDSSTWFFPKRNKK